MSDDLNKVVVSLILDGAESFDSEAKRAAQSLGTISIKLDQYERSTRVAGDSTRSFLSRMRDYTIVFGGVHNAIQMATDALTAMPKSIITANAQLERNRVLLTGLQSDATSFAQAQAQANSEMQKLLSVSSTAPFSLDAILGSYTKLRVGGIENTTDAMKGLLDTAAKSGASSEQLKLASVAIQQMAGKGVISMEELRGQLGEAVPQAMNIMSRAVGMDMATMVKVISTGSMESKSALELFFREMKLENDGAAANMANTWDGTIEQIKKSWGMLVTDDASGTPFFAKMKEQAQDLNAFLKTNEAKQYIQDVDSALASLLSGAVSVTKSIVSNIGLVGAALVGAFSAGRISSVISGIAQIKAAWDKSADGNDSYRAKIAKEAADQIANIRKEQEKLTKLYRDSEILGHQSTQVMRDAYRDQYNAQMKVYDAQIKNIEASARVSQRMSTLNTVLGQTKSAANAVANAFGGWSTIAITAIASVIGYITQAIMKQRELNKTLLETKGINATEEQAEYAKERLKDLDEQKARVESLQRAVDVARQSNKSMYGTTVADPVTTNLQNQLKVEQEKLRVLSSEHEMWKKIAQTSAEARDEENSKAGESIFTGSGSSYMARLSAIQAEVARRKDEAIEQLKSVKDEAQRSAEWEQKRAEIDNDLMGRQIQVYKDAQAELEAQRQELTKNLDPSGKGIDLNSLSKDQRAELARLNGAINYAVGKQRELREAMMAPVGKLNLLNQSENKNTKKDAGQSVDDSLDVQIAKLREKYAALQDNRDMETKSAELEARIANGDFKGKSAEFIAQLRAKAAEYDSLNNKIKKFTERQKEAEQASQDLQNQIVSLEKKAGKSEIDANNPYLQWARSTQGEKEALEERINQLKELDAYNEEEAKKAQHAAELIARIDQNNAEDMITEKDRALTQALMTTRQAAKFEHQEELNRLATFEATVMKMQESPAKAKMLAQIDSVKRKMEALYDRERDPFKKWLASSEDLADGVNNKLVSTFDGLFDGIAERIVDTTANFGDMVRSLADDLQKYVIKLLMINALKSAIMGTSYGESLSGFFGGSSGGDSSWLSYDTGLSSNGASKFGVSSADSYSFTSDPYTFANGGIMTPYGDLPLKKYANGGVATSPQVAIFGEADMNEAYVPLPDGRTIPVTLTTNGNGQAASATPNITLNVINQSGTQMEAETGSPRFDGESYVIDVVLNALSRPGRLRTAVKGVK